MGARALLAIAVAASGLLAACGQKGPLYLPAQAGIAAKPVGQATSAAAASTATR